MASLLLFFSFFTSSSCSLAAMKNQYALGGKIIIWMKSSLKTDQLGMCGCACAVSYIQLWRQRAVLAVKGSAWSRGQMNSRSRQDSEGTGLFRVNRRFPHQRRYNHSLNMWEGAGTVLRSLHEHNWHLKCLSLAREGQVISLLSASWQGAKLTAYQERHGEAVCLNKSVYGQAKTYRSEEVCLAILSCVYFICPKSS